MRIVDAHDRAVRATLAWVERNAAETRLKDPETGRMMRAGGQKIVAPTFRHDTSRVGKTVAGIRVIAERARNTLVLVHLRPLLEQWVTQLAMFLDVDPRTIGRIGDGKRRATGVIDVATFQSLVRGGTVADLVRIRAGKADNSLRLRVAIRAALIGAGPGSNDGNPVVVTRTACGAAQQ